MRFEDVPEPERIAARPHDERGYPVPAITPWEDGVPRFAISSPRRALICGAERRCSVCALEVAPGPVWRVVNGAETEAVEAARAAGRPYVNKAPTVEAPGHRVCMLYAALVCPFLARPNARRGTDADLGPLSARDRGEARGEGGAVVGYETYEYAVVEGRTLFRFTGLVEFLPFGDDLADLLAEAVRAEAGMTIGPSPEYLLRDESAVAAWRRAAEPQGRPLS